jgi:thiamine kinase-like enzyme
MRRKIMIIGVVAWLALPGVLPAQMQGGSTQGGSSGKVGSGQPTLRQRNTDMTNQMMDEMRQMMGQGHMTPAQQERMQGMINQLGQMKQQMGMSQQMEQEYQRRLQEMQQRLNTVKKQGEHQS